MFHKPKEPQPLPPDMPQPAPVEEPPRPRPQPKEIALFALCMLGLLGCSHEKINDRDTTPATSSPSCFTLITNENDSCDPLGPCTCINHPNQPKNKVDCVGPNCKEIL